MEQERELEQEQERELELEQERKQEQERDLELEQEQERELELEQEQEREQEREREFLEYNKIKRSVKRRSAFNLERLNDILIRGDEDDDLPLVCELSQNSGDFPAIVCQNSFRRNDIPA